MNKRGIFLVFAMILISGCGYTSRKNELVGQVKKVLHHTPLICPDWISADVSLGLMRNGVGSMSTEDLWLTVDNEEHLAILKKAAESGQPVKVEYDRRRVTFCTEQPILTKVELTK